MPSRRDVLKASLSLPMSAVIARRVRSQARRVVVVGAGAFGGWTALDLVRRGARVTLVDAWGPGNARASSGGETRVIRAGYGSRAIYTRLTARALELWRAHDKARQRGLFRQTGVLWMFGRDAGFADETTRALEAERVKHETLTPAAAARRYPQIDFTGVSSALLEPEAGYLHARRACEDVVECLVAEGGEYRQAAVASPVRASGQRFTEVRLADGSSLPADAFVFACGPWLRTLFPDVIGRLVASTRQEIYYFGTPAGDERFSDARCPAWIDFGGRVIYGTPGNANRGFKVADDTAGPAFEPTGGLRTPTDAGINAARAFLARRFPALAKAPLLGAEVCQYEATPDSDFIVDTHPAATNVWIVGGGSGHGFKMGPALGEVVASCVLGDATPDPTFRLARFESAKGTLSKSVTSGAGRRGPTSNKRSRSLARGAGAPAIQTKEKWS